MLGLLRKGTAAAAAAAAANGGPGPVSPGLLRRGPADQAGTSTAPAGQAPGRGSIGGAAASQVLAQGLLGAPCPPERHMCHQPGCKKEEEGHGALKRAELRAEGALRPGR